MRCQPERVTNRRCRWVYDADIDGGKFLVPGCWNRAVNGDYADCHCKDGPETIGDQIKSLRRRIAALEKGPTP